MDIKKSILENAEELIELRREFHMIPETGYEEYQTSSKIKAYLENLGMETEVITKTGVVALLNKESDGPMFMIRSDIDALDVKEQNDLPFKSKHEGKMHACGHDAHMATLLIAAKILSAHASEIHGKVLFVFQPNEEGAGALNMINEGLLEKYPAQACAAIHVWPYLKTGQFGITEGAVMAGMDHFHIEVRGIGGHTGNPHLAKDPIICATNIIQSLQSIQTREIDIQKPTVIMVGKMESGTAANIIPEKVDLYGTARYLYRMTDNEDLKVRMERYVNGICTAYGMSGHIDWEEGSPAVFNDSKLVEIAKAAAIATAGNSEDISEIRSTAGEDFSEFCERIPGVFCHIGVGNEEKDTCYSLHHPKFNIDEDALKLMVEMHVRIATEWIERSNRNTTTS